MTFKKTTHSTSLFDSLSLFIDRFNNPIVKHFKYFGIDINPLLSTIDTKNFQSMYSKIEADLNR